MNIPHSIHFFKDVHPQKNAISCTHADYLKFSSMQCTYVNFEPLYLSQTLLTFGPIEHIYVCMPLFLIVCNVIKIEVCGLLDDKQNDDKN